MSLHRKSDGTRITAATISTVTTDVTDDDPMVTVDNDLLHRREYPGGGGSSKPADSADDYTTLAFRAGAQVRTSELLALMTPAKVTSIAPATGPAAGGTACTVTGTGLAEVTGITVGGTAATNVTVVDDTKVTFTTPAGTAGAKPVVITDDAGAVTVASGFTYTA